MFHLSDMENLKGVYPAFQSYVRLESMLKIAISQSPEPYANLSYCPDDRALRRYIILSLDKI